MKKHAFKILSIDGGGIRGILPCTILTFIEQQIGPLSDKCDLIAGTSTGGIIAMGLVAPNENAQNAYSAEDMLDLYVQNGNKIFQKRKTDFWSWLSQPNKFSRTLVGNPYDERPLEGILAQKFNHTRLKECLTNLLVTTYEIQKGKTFYFLSRLAQTVEAENFELREVARATSAAPTYFSPAFAQWKSETEAFIDGGVFANNPAILAYGEAKEIWKRAATLSFDPVVLSDDHDLPFFMLSIGTGYAPQTISGADARKWRTAQWIQPMLDNIFMNSVASSTHFTMQHLLPAFKDGTPRYQRLDMQIPPEQTEMDNASSENIDKLCEIAQQYVKQNQVKLLKICEYLND